MKSRGHFYKSVEYALFTLSILGGIGYAYGTRAIAGLLGVSGAWNWAGGITVAFSGIIVGIIIGGIGDIIITIEEKKISFPSENNITGVEQKDIQKSASKPYEPMYADNKGKKTIAEPSDDGLMKKCPLCGLTQRADFISCRKCGAKFITE